MWVDLRTAAFPVKSLYAAGCGERERQNYYDA